MLFNLVLVNPEKIGNFFAVSDSVLTELFLPTCPLYLYLLNFKI